MPLGEERKSPLKIGGKKGLLSFLGRWCLLGFFSIPFSEEKKREES
jgi:hypothetical protein